jgi:hypothetical protein
MEIKINKKIVESLYMTQQRKNPNEIFSVYDPIQIRWNPYNPLTLIFCVFIHTFKFVYDVYNSIKNIFQSQFFKWV